MAIPEAKSTFYEHVKSLRTLLNGTTNQRSVSRLIIATVAIWQELKYPQLRNGCHHQYGTTQYIRDSRTQIFAKWLAEIKDFNISAYWLASAYAILVGSEARTKSSLFFTPPLLAARVISCLENSGADLSTHKWHDPACGGAAFLVPVAQKMAQVLTREGKRPSEVLHHIELHLSGTDLEPTLLELSRQFLRMALYELIEATGRAPEFNLNIGNGLTVTPLHPPDVVICNPPYRKLKKEEYKNYTSEYSKTIQGQPNIYSLFIQRSIQMVTDGGYAGLLTPTSYLSGQHFSKLRKWVLDNSQPKRLEILGNRKSTFIDVEQETAILITKRPTKTERQSNHIALAARSETGDFTEIGNCDLPKCGRPWPIAKKSEDFAVISKAFRSTFRLSTYGYQAKIGHLVGYRDTRKRCSTDDKISLEHQVVPLVWATDITPTGFFQHGRGRKGKQKELFVQQPCNASGLIKKPAVLLQRVTSSDQPRRLVCTTVPESWLEKYGGIVAENHVIVLEAVEGTEPAIHPKTLVSILRSETVDRLFRAISGAANVSIFELNELPLPDPKIIKRELTLDSCIESAVLKGYSDASTSSSIIATQLSSAHDKSFV